jgi:hypothetical protein
VRWLFYTYDQVDNAGEPSADRIIDEYQDLKVGDLISMWHESHGLAIAYKVDSLEVPRWMLWWIDRTRTKSQTAHGVGDLTSWRPEVRGSLLA